MKTLSIVSRSTFIVLALCILAAGCCDTELRVPTKVTVLTYNIYHGEDASGDSNLDAVGRIVNSLEPDLVALQEVDNKTTRVKGLDLTAELSQRTGMRGFFGRAMDYAGGQYGEAVLCRHPVVRIRNNPLPHTSEAEPRTALEVHVEVSTGERVVFVGTHLDHLRDQKNRMMQASQIVHLYENYDLPIILAGDLNAVPGSDAIKLLCREWSYAGQANPDPTFPSIGPRRKIDYIMYKPERRWRVLETRVIDEKVASDHCPVFTVLELLPERENTEQ